jgi:hypothetical protein
VVYSYLYINNILALLAKPEKLHGFNVINTAHHVDPEIMHLACTSAPVTLDHNMHHCPYL